MRFHACPCCGSHTISVRGAYEICSVCNWEDDPAQAKDLDLRGGANGASLSEARAAWKRRKEQG